MGAGASATLPATLDKAAAQQAAGEAFNEAAFDRAAKNGAITRDEFLQAAAGITPLAAAATTQNAMAKLRGNLTDVEPGTRVGVVTMLGSLCPVTLGHVQAFVEARRLLLGEAGVTRPARLERFGAMLGLFSLNTDRSVSSKLEEKGERSLSYEQRMGLVQLAVREHAWLGWEGYEGEMLGELRQSYPELIFEHFYMNGADDVRRNKTCRTKRAGVHVGRTEREDDHDGQTRRHRGGGAIGAGRRHRPRRRALHYGSGAAGHVVF